MAFRCQSERVADVGAGVAEDSADDVRCVGGGTAAAALAHRSLRGTDDDRVQTGRLFLYGADLALAVRRLHDATSSVCSMTYCSASWSVKNRSTITAGAAAS